MYDFSKEHFKCKSFTLFYIILHSVKVPIGKGGVTLRGERRHGHCT